MGIRIFQLPTFSWDPGIDSSLSHVRARKLDFCDDDLCGRRHTARLLAKKIAATMMEKKKKRNIQKRTRQIAYL